MKTKKDEIKFFDHTKPKFNEIYICGFNLEKEIKRLINENKKR